MYTEILIDDELADTALFLAKKRIVFEYPRKGYGQYDEKNHLMNLQYGYLGELAFLNLITRHFSDKYASVSPPERFVKLQDENFKYNFVIGQTDGGFDFSIKGKEIDVKTYGTKLIKNIDEIKRYNLLIDMRQAQNHQADIYIQAFILGNRRPEKCIIAGYYEGLPPVNYNFPKPAHAVAIDKLKPVDQLLKEYF